MADEDKQDDKPQTDTLVSPFTSGAETHAIGNDSPAPTPGLSISPGLQPVPNSQAPALADDTLVSHVMGPGQAAVDPVAAGLDTQHVPLTRNDNRVVTQTGELAAGPRPATYAEKGADVPQAGPSDGTTVAPVSDAEAAKAPGPNAVPATGSDADKAS